MAEPPAPESNRQVVKPRPRKVQGVTYRVATPLGTAFITVNINGNDEPFEVFANVGKAGSDTASVSDLASELVRTQQRLEHELRVAGEAQDYRKRVAPVLSGELARSMQQLREYVEWSTASVVSGLLPTFSASDDWARMVWLMA